ncbi:hypothetical protein BHM03_00024712 [Ensete ventricosum]|nr:hypothetical protein BHM03_00024712 [Ensete ventricosum]
MRIATKGPYNLPPWQRDALLKILRTCFYRLSFFSPHFRLLDQVGCPPQVRPVSGLLFLLVRKEHNEESQVAPNSWRYLIAFLGECQGAGIIPSRTLFFACFHLCKSRAGFYLTARAGFKVSGAPINNKGWKARYFFISTSNWEFRVDWSIHLISNIPPFLPEESIMVNRPKGILPLSRAIRDMIELWLVEAGLSLASQGAMDLDVLRKKLKASGGKSSSPARVTSSPPEVEEIRVDAMPKRPARSAAPEQAATAQPRKRPMKDLCGTRVCKDNEGYYVLQIINSAPKDPDASMRARWPNLTYSTKVWDNSQATSEFGRGVLHPTLAKELYTLPSEVLMAKAAKQIALISHVSTFIIFDL